MTYWARYGDRTRGRVALLRILTRTEARFIAARCRVSEGAVYHWTSGRRRPSETARLLLRENYGIPLDSWDLPPHRPHGDGKG